MVMKRCAFGPFGFGAFLPSNCIVDSVNFYFGFWPIIQLDGVALISTIESIYWPTHGIS